MEYGKMDPCTCGNRKPKYSGCSDCGRQYCEECATLIDNDLVCKDCVAARVADLMEADDPPEPDCTCERIDVDLMDARGCEVHGR